MKNKYSTTRLLLDELSLNDAAFIMELVNTPGWLKFIGNRNVNNFDEARVYIQKILDNPNVRYWMVRLQDEKTPVGVVTFIKREYLDHPDIGFAFLPRHSGKGYAQEASLVVLNDIISDGHEKILATTVKDNVNSIRLLEKLGFSFSREIDVDKEQLSVYERNKKETGSHQ